MGVFSRPLQGLVRVPGWLRMVHTARLPAAAQRAGGAAHPPAGGGSPPWPAGPTGRSLAPPWGGLAHTGPQPCAHISGPVLSPRLPGTVASRTLVPEVSLPAQTVTSKHRVLVPYAAPMAPPLETGGPFPATWGNHTAAPRVVSTFTACLSSTWAHLRLIPQQNPPVCLQARAGSDHL